MISLKCFILWLAFDKRPSHFAFQCQIRYQKLCQYPTSQSKAELSLKPQFSICGHGLCLVLFAFQLTVSLNACLLVKTKWASWMSFPINIFSNLWVTACNNDKLLEVIIGKNWSPSTIMYNKGIGVTKSWGEMRGCEFNLVFNLRGVELANITDRGTPHFLPPPTPKKSCYNE